MFDAAGIEVLEAGECLRLLSTVRVGRIVFTDRALPAIEPVTFTLHDGSVIIRTRGGTKLAAAARNAVVALEADEIDLERQAGWSVTVVGRSNEVTDPAELEHLRALHLRSWAPGDHDHYIRVNPEVINGRRLQPPS